MPKALLKAPPAPTRQEISWDCIVLVIKQLQGAICSRLYTFDSVVACPRGGYPDPDLCLEGIR
jgi:hypothetical protein